MKKLIKNHSDKLKTVITTFKKYTSKLTPEDDWVEPLRRRILVLLDPIFRPLGRNLIFECHDEDYMYTVAKDSDAVERGLYPQYKRNLTSTRKYRMVDGERQWTSGSWVYDPDDTEWQHHVYLFDTGSYNEAHTDIYGHKEASAANDPSAHHRSWQEHGDPDENVVKLLAEAGLERVEK